MCGLDHIILSIKLAKIEVPVLKKWVQLHVRTSKSQELYPQKPIDDSKNA